MLGTNYRKWNFVECATIYWNRTLMTEKLTVINSSVTKATEIEVEVPQGSILGPIGPVYYSKLPAQSKIFRSKT